MNHVNIHAYSKQQVFFSDILAIVQQYNINQCQSSTAIPRFNRGFRNAIEQDSRTHMYAICSAKPDQTLQIIGDLL